MRKIFAALAVIFMIAGVGIALYPTIADMIFKVGQEQSVLVYSSVVQGVDTTKLDEMWNAAKEYNKTVKETGMFLITGDDSEYNSLLNVEGDGLMGYVEVPDQNILLPIYHGTDDETLETAVGHLEGTSLPTDENGVHSVITGHTGLVNLDLFTDIHKMAEGDTFTVSILNRVLTYTVDDISVVLPEEVYNLEINSAKNYCTLVTCTPYGVNDHRLLVRGTLTNVQETGTTTETQRAYEYTETNNGMNNLITYAGYGLIGLVVILIIGYVIWQYKERN